MPKIAILGDVHGDFNAISKMYEREKPDLILQCGDLAAQSRGERRLNVGEYPASLPPVPFVWVLGNHENLDTYQSVGIPIGMYGSRITLFQLANGKHIWFKTTGIGGIFGRTRKIHWGYSTNLEDFKSRVIKKVIKFPDVLISHETCSPFLKDNQEMGSPMMTEMCQAIKPKWHFSGHHHYYEEVTLHGVNHVRLPRIINGYGILEGETFKFVQTPIYLNEELL